MTTEQVEQQGQPIKEDLQQAFDAIKGKMRALAGADLFAQAQEIAEAYENMAIQLALKLMPAAVEPAESLKNPTYLRFPTFGVSKITYASHNPTVITFMRGELGASEISKEAVDREKRVRQAFRAAQQESGYGGDYDPKKDMSLFIKKSRYI